MSRIAVCVALCGILYFYLALWTSAPRETTRFTLSQLTDDVPECVFIASNAAQRSVTECEYVRSYCGEIPNLFDYLQLRYCTFESIPYVAFLILVPVMILMISLLASTADNFFVPALETISDMLDLSPNIAGITLLALGNGAPDVFTSLAGMQASDMSIVLGSLTGASVLVTCFVLGCVIIFGDDVKVSRIAFLRDTIVFAVISSVIYYIAHDGVVYLWEAIGFVMVYVGYVLSVVGYSRYIRSRYGNAFSRTLLTPEESNENVVAVETSFERPRGVSVRSIEILSISDVDEEDNAVSEEPLAGLTWNPEDSFAGKIQFVAEYPFSVFRWLTVVAGDRSWGPTRRLFVCVSPPFIVLLFMLDLGTDTFLACFGDSKIPIFPFVFVIAIAISALLFKTLPVAPTRIAVLFPFLAFAISITWLHLLASEAVAVAQSLGIIMNVSSALLGLTVLAFGNSVGDLISNVSVAKNGNGMAAVSACFGAPLLINMLGLGLSLTITCIEKLPEPFEFSVDLKQLLPSWIALALGLLTSLVGFPMLAYRPNRVFGGFLIFIYVAFLITSVFLVK